MKIKKLSSLLLAAVLAATALTGCGNSSDDPNASRVGYANEEGYAEGGLRDTMHTDFFDFTVNSAYTCDTYEDYTPAEGYQMLIAEITVKNTFSEEIEMYDTDFQIQWNDNADDAYDWPITYYLQSGETVGQNMLPDVYKLSKKESRTGILAFEVPVDSSDYSISYLTYIDDGSEEGITGDLFFVYFDAPGK